MKNYYKGEFSLLTKSNDTLDNLNTFLKSIGSRQFIQKRPYKRQFKYALVHYSTQGVFTNTIFDLGETIHCRPFNSIIKD